MSNILENWKVYKHTNLKNNKIYVGITKQNLNRRWRNGKGYKDNSYFTNSIIKYGWDGFKHEILFEGLTRSEASLKEIEIIKELDCLQPKGYNISGGGINQIISESTKNKLSKQIICDNKIFDNAKSCSEYLGIKKQTLVSFLNGGSSIPIEYYNRGLSYVGEEHKLRIRRKVLNYNSKSIICDGIIYKTITEFCEKNNQKYSKVYSWLNRKIMPKEWIDRGLNYFNNPINFEKQKSQSEICYENLVKEKMVEVWLNGIKYNSMSECSKKTGIPLDRLCEWKSIKSKHKNSRKYKIDKIEFMDGKDEIRNN